MAKEIKKTSPDLPILFGGYFITALPEYAMKNYPIDFGIIGEGEVTTPELVNALQRQETDFSQIKGLAWKRDAQITVNERRERFVDLDGMFPKRSDLPSYDYQRNLMPLPFSKRRYALVHSSRGCRFNCGFCSTPRMFRGGWKTRSVSDIADELESLVTKGKNYITFRDEDFFGSKERIRELCKEIKGRGLKFHWRSFVNPLDLQTDADLDLLKTMEESGCSSFIIGIESMNDIMLGSVNKKLRVDKTHRAFQLLGETRIMTMSTYSVGYPEEDEKILSDSLEQLLTLPLDEAYVTFLCPFPGTALYDQTLEKELFLDGVETAWEKYNCEHPMIKSPIKPERLIELRSNFARGPYRKHFLQKMLERIKQDQTLIPMYQEYVNAMF